MIHLIQKALSQTFKMHLFEPSAQKVPNTAERLLIASKNRQIFSLLLGVTIIYPLAIPFLDFDYDVHVFNELITIVITSLFLLACRSYAWIFHTCYALHLSFAPYFTMHANPELLFFNVSFALILPPLIYYISRSFFLTGMTGIMQIVFFQTLYKSLFVSLIEEIGIELFAEKFFHALTLCALILIPFFVLALYNLEKKTIELFNSKKQTEDILEQHKTFIFSFSHELRNPLNSLLGNLQLALLSNLPPDTRDMIKTAKICSELLLQYINNVLDTGKFEIGKLEVNPVPTNVHDLFQRVWTISHELINRKKLGGFLMIHKEVPSQMLMDSQKVNQIFMNLVGNSVKFTDRGSINVTVKWLPQTNVNDDIFEPKPYDDEDEGIFQKEQNIHRLASSKDIQVIHHTRRTEGVVKIIVQDTGCGMSQEALEKLFEKFSQVSDDPSKRSIGTGLGLFITRELCKKMDGDVRAYSKQGVGSTFVVCIPTISIPVERQHIGNAEPDTLKELLTSRKIKAIVVDDSPFNVTLVSNYFAKIGVEVVATASNGLEGLKEYTNHRNKGIFVDIVTLDIDMPKMNGKEACKKIREFESDKRLKETNMLMISGNYDGSQLKECLNPGGVYRISHFFKKPLLFEEFCSVVGKIMR